MSQNFLPAGAVWLVPLASCSCGVFLVEDFQAEVGRPPVRDAALAACIDHLVGLDDLQVIFQL